MKKTGEKALCPTVREQRCSIKHNTQAPSVGTATFLGSQIKMGLGSQAKIKDKSKWLSVLYLFLFINDVNLYH